jgi:hypothetical protein
VRAGNLAEWNIFEACPGAFDDCESAVEDDVSVGGAYGVFAFGSEGNKSAEDIDEGRIGLTRRRFL